MAQSIMMVGTSSNVGKSILAAALCRILAQDGYKVAPFKAQNMSLNSAVTPSGREIGRAQAVQAEAAGILPNEHMNPVLLEPTGNMQSQIVLQGRPIGTRPAKDYFYDAKEELWQAVVASYEYLAVRYDVVVIEGAGSPVEMNLKERDIANMKTADMAGAPVLLVADIDRGGVFASIVGTLQLLAPKERSQVKGIVINKFRGDASLFHEGRRWLEEYTCIPVLGVIPYIPNLEIDEEDSEGLSSQRYRKPNESTESIRVGIVQLPHISNFTDFDPLFLEPDVDTYFCTRPEDLEVVDAIVIPGTKSTILDLSWLHQQGWSKAILGCVERGAYLLGICGGYQMLGTAVYDPEHNESHLDNCEGLALFDAVTTMGSEKRTVLVKGSFTRPFEGIHLEGYEIHMGVTQFQGAQQPLAMTREAHGPFANEPAAEGHVAHDGRVIGTYLHGLLHNDEFRGAWLNRVRRSKGLERADSVSHVQALRENELNRLAKTVREHLDMKQIYQLLGENRSP